MAGVVEHASLSLSLSLSISLSIYLSVSLSRSVSVSECLKSWSRARAVVGWLSLGGCYTPKSRMRCVQQGDVSAAGGRACSRGTCVQQERAFNRA